MSLLKLLCCTLLLIIPSSQADTLFNSFKRLFDTDFGRAAPFRDSPKTVDSTCMCGQSGSGRDDDLNKIINGQEVNPKYKYPWMALLKRSGRFICGGSLINTRFVLSAAHCVVNFPASAFEVVLGIHSIVKAGESIPTDLTGEPFAITRSIQKLKIHGSYNKARIDSPFDIALLRMSQEVKFTPQIMPICLPKQASQHNLPRMNTVITGWGLTEGGITSDVLREAAVEAFDAVICHGTGYGGEITNEMICAALPGKDTCQGDSGGPLFYKSATANTILGITSWGEGCAVPNFPGVYTRVSEFVNWIYARARAGKYCKNPDNGQ